MYDDDIYLCEPEGQALPFELSWRALHVEEGKLQELRALILRELLTLTTSEGQRKVIEAIQDGCMEVPKGTEGYDLFNGATRIYQCLDIMTSYPEMLMTILSYLQDAYGGSGKYTAQQAQLRVLRMFLEYVGNRFSITEYEDSEYELEVTLQPKKTKG